MTTKRKAVTARGGRKLSMNTKQEAERLAALNAIARHVGLIASCSSLKVSDSELARRLAVYGPSVVDACVSVITDLQAHPIRRAACGTLLECFIPGWRDMVPPEVVGMVVERGDGEVHKWRSAVLERDGYKCTECGSTDELHAHHIVRWADAPSLRVIVENGRTLCRQCHEAIHAKTRC